MRGLTATPKTTLRQAQGRLCGTDSIVIETGDGVGVRDEKTHPAKEGRVDWIRSKARSILSSLFVIEDKKTLGKEGAFDEDYRV